MWLLETETFNKMQAMLDAGFKPTDEQIASYNARFEVSESNDLPSCAKVSGGVGEINIDGVLTKKPSFWAMLFGGGNATYKDIMSAIATFEKDASVSEIVLNIDSPGGSVDGMFDAMDAIKEASKPIKANIHGYCASAAYGLASQATKIVSKSKGNFIGSIGVAIKSFNRDDVITLTSTNAPDKAPDPKTEKGKQTIIKELDAIHDMFVASISSGRSTTSKKVNENFGRGSVFLAEEALKRGMIDEVVTKPTPENNNNSNNNINDNIKRAELMDLKTLKRDHSDLYEEVRKEAIADERDRVNAHLNAGEQAGAMPVAVKAIKEGDGFTLAIQSQYLTAGLNKRDIGAHDADQNEIGNLKNLSNKDTKSNPALSANDESDQVLASVLKNLGVEQ